MPARQMVVRSSVGRLSALRRLGPTLHDARVRAVAVGSVGVGVVDVRSALTPAGGMTVFAGTAGLTTTTNGVAPRFEIGARSLIGSYERCGYKLGNVEKLPEISSNV